MVKNKLNLTNDSKFYGLIGFYSIRGPHFVNVNFKQSSHNFHQPQPAKVAPVAIDKSIASHYPLDLSNAPSRINCENFEPVRVVAPSVQRELDRIKAEKEKRRQL